MNSAIANSVFGMFCSFTAKEGNRVQSASEYPLTTGPSLADQAYTALRKSITDGVFVPGQRLTERALATLLGVSPTPVREAISRLEHERLLHRDGRALTVAAPTVEQLRELVYVEAALRGVAARIAAVRASDRELAEIAALHTQAQSVQNEGRTVEYIATDTLTLTRQFHAKIDETAGNPMLIDMIATAKAFDWSIRLRAATTLGSRYPAQAGHRDHQEILEALQERDADRAERLARADAIRGGERFLAFAEQETSTTT
ncbi:MAG: hypothetical protein JWQ81_7532 [Amycolatopsis sp.]|nr:hypothetical protein [Amycolatopsis sp.]